MSSNTAARRARSTAIRLPDDSSGNAEHAVSTLGAGARSEWVDIAKGLAIALMVLGHVGGGLLAGGILNKHGMFPFLYEWIYTFHMASFMLLAGLFLERAADRGVTIFLVGRLGSLYYPSVL